MFKCKYDNFKTEELATRTRALTREQMELVLDNIPVELCLARVAKELESNKVFISKIRDAMNAV